MAATYLDMTAAAKEAGICIRHFREVMAQTKPPLKIFNIGRKQFVLRSVLNPWIAANKGVTYHGRN